MNYKNSAIAELENFSNKFEDYSLGQILRSVVNRKPEGVSVKQWLYEVSDEDLYTAIEKTKLIEAADGITK